MDQLPEKCTCSFLVVDQTVIIVILNKAVHSTASHHKALRPFMFLAAALLDMLDTRLYIYVLSNRDSISFPHT